MFTVALLALAVAGCTTTGTPTVHPTDTTPSSMPTQTAPTGTPAPTSWLDGYTEYPHTGMDEQTLFNQAVGKFLVYYHNSDWTMPKAGEMLHGAAHHGVIYKLQFTNPNEPAKTITAGYDIKSTIQYYSGGSRGWMPVAEDFYDPANGTLYGSLTLAKGESKTVYMLAYINDDSAYDSYGKAIDTVSIDWNPQYYAQVY
jgi:hypothetical protein